MTRRARRLLAQLAGLALVLLALWLVGLDDRVVDAAGAVHRGTLVARDADAVVLRTAEGDVRFPAAEVRSVRVGLPTAFRPLRGRPHIALLGLLLHLAAIVVVHLRWGLLLRAAGLATPVRTVLELGWIGQFTASLAPGGIAIGDVVKALYVAPTHPGRRTRAVVSVFFDRALGLVVLCAIALAAALLAPGTTRLAATRPVLTALLAGALVFALLLFSPRLRRALGLARLFARLPFQVVVREAADALAIYGGKRRALTAAVLLAVLSHSLVLGAFWLYAAALGASMSLFAVAVAVPIAQMIAAVPGLPGGFGVGDLAFVAFLPEAGVPAGTALALSFTYRVLHLVIALPAGFWLFRRRGPLAPVAPSA